VAIEVSETTWNLLGIALPMLHFQSNLLFPYVLWYLKTITWLTVKMIIAVVLIQLWH